MNILFVYSVDEIYSFARPLLGPGWLHFGISYVSSFLKKHRHHTGLVVLGRILGRKNYDIIDKYLEKFHPRLICFTAVSSEYRFICGMAKYIKSRYPAIYLLIGGPHVSLNPQDTESSEFDAICIGEGENPTLELVSQLERGLSPAGVSNLWIKKGGSIVEKNLPRPFLQDLDSLPFPDREIWQEWMPSGTGLTQPVLLGRGCPFECTYCCNHGLRKIASGMYVRLRSADNITEEIKEIAAKYLITENIYLEVETIGVNKEWAMQLCAKLQQLNLTLSKPLSFGVNLRITPKADLEALFAEFKKSNFNFINIGLESGSERVRREILNRDYSNEDIINTVNLARKYGLKVHFYNLIGVPGETVAEFKETVRMNRLCQPDFHYTSIFYPYPGTALHALCKKQGLLKKDLDTEMERHKAVINLPSFNKHQIQRSFLWFDYYLYKGRKPAYKLIARVFALGIRNNFLYRRMKHNWFFKRLRRVVRRLYSID